MAAEETLLKQINMDNSYITTSASSGGLITMNPRGAGMNIIVAQQAVGYVATVFTSLDAERIPLVDTKPYKTAEKAKRAGRKAAIKLAKRK